MSGPADLLEKLRLSIAQNPHPETSQLYWQLNKEQSRQLSASERHYIEAYLSNLQKFNAESGVDFNRREIDETLVQEQKRDEFLLEAVLTQLPDKLKPLLIDGDSFALGILNLPEINGQAMAAPNGGWLVVIHEGLCAFFCKVARALAICHIEHGEDGVKRLADNTLVNFKEVCHLIRVSAKG